ncbi:c-type cytochrome [Neptunicella sp.]|uniref:c-type cytochrome n=1 Tax=Neptunicella sp. TaxID=2125986 RepID=UPI003F68F26D
MKIIYTLLAFIALTIGGAAIFIYSGIYPIGADVPHSAAEFWVLENLRENSIERASSEISVPSLESADLLLTGGPNYNDMCAGCHLKPGKQKSDMSVGLYPAPPNLSASSHTEDHQHGDATQLAGRQFWVIKHGIKASGMPAWGATHDDQRIWAMVAFLQKLPQLTPEQYQILTARDLDED